MIERQLFFATADTTAETVFTNSTTQLTTLTSINIAQGSAAAATTVRISKGADGATTRVFEQPIPAGAGSYTFPVHIPWTGTETMQLSSTTTDDVAVCVGKGYSVVVS